MTGTQWVAVGLALAVPVVVIVAGLIARRGNPVEPPEAQAKRPGAASEES